MPLHSNQKQEKTFNGEMVAGSLLVAETREVARLLLQGGGPDV